AASLLAQGVPRGAWHPSGPHERHVVVHARASPRAAQALSYLLHRARTVLLGPGRRARLVIQELCFRGTWRQMGGRTARHKRCSWRSAVRYVGGCVLYAVDSLCSTCKRYKYAEYIVSCQQRSRALSVYAVVACDAWDVVRLGDAQGYGAGGIFATVPGP